MSAQGIFEGEVNGMDTVRFEIESPLKECFLHCEVECVRECCGIDAIRADCELIAEWGGTVPASQVTEALGQVREVIARVREDQRVLCCSFLNHCTVDEKARAGLLVFLAEFEKGLELAVGRGGA